MKENKLVEFLRGSKMKADKFVRRCGPYKVESILDGQGVRLIVYPAFPDYGENWAITRAKGEDGGPSIFTAMALGNFLQDFLNQPYSQDAIDVWRQIMDEVEDIIIERNKEGVE